MIPYLKSILALLQERVQQEMLVFLSHRWDPSSKYLHLCPSFHEQDTVTLF